MIVYVFSFLFPYLLVLWLLASAAARLGVNVRGGRQRFALCGAAAAVVLAPPWWTPLARCVVGVNANFSVPLTALVLARVWERLGPAEAGSSKDPGTRLLGRRDTLAAWVFGLAAGLVLYPMALGLGDFDPYELGWEFSWLFVLALAVTVALLYTRNRFGIVLVASILAYDLRLLESPNLWDYLVDPFYTLTAAGALTWHLARARRRRAGGPAPRQAASAVKAASARPGLRSRSGCFGGAGQGPCPPPVSSPDLS